MRAVFFYLLMANLIIVTLVVVIQVVFKVLVVVEILRNRRNDVNAEIQNKKQKDLAKTVVILNVILIVTAFRYFLATQIAYFYAFLNYTDASMILQFCYYYQPVFVAFHCKPSSLLSTSKRLSSQFARSFSFANAGSVDE